MTMIPLTVSHGVSDSGTTAQLPTNAADGHVYYDQTFQCLWVYDATTKVWNAVTPLRKAGAPVDGTSGTGATYAQASALLIDTTGCKLYINTGTKASPVWTVAGAQTT